MGAVSKKEDKAKDEMLVLCIKLATEVRERLKKTVTNQVFKPMCLRKENHVKVVV